MQFIVILVKTCPPLFASVEGDDEVKKSTFVQSQNAVMTYKLLFYYSLGLVACMSIGSYFFYVSLAKRTPRESVCIVLFAILGCLIALHIVNCTPFWLRTININRYITFYPMVTGILFHIGRECLNYISYAFVISYFFHFKVHDAGDKHTLYPFLLVLFIHLLDKARNWMKSRKVAKAKTLTLKPFIMHTFKCGIIPSLNI